MCVYTDRAARRRGATRSWSRVARRCWRSCTSTRRTDVASRTSTSSTTTPSRPPSRRPPRPPRRPTRLLLRPPTRLPSRKGNTPLLMTRSPTRTIIRYHKLVILLRDIMLSNSCLFRNILKSRTLLLYERMNVIMTVYTSRCTH